MSNDISFYAFSASYVILGAILILQLLRWLKAIRLHPGMTYLASRETARCWMLTTKRWMLYLSIVGLCIACMALYEFSNDRYSPFFPIAYFCVISLSTISWNTLPPGILFLASSSRKSGKTLNIIRNSRSAAGLRIVYLLNELADVSDFLPRSNTFIQNNLRVIDDSLWKDVVHRLCMVTPIIVIDTRIVTKCIIHELQLIEKNGLLPRTLMITKENGSAPAIIAAGVTNMIRTTKPTLIESNLKRMIQAPYLPNPVDAYHYLHATKEADMTRSALTHGVFSKGVRALCAIGLFIFAQNILFSPIVNKPKGVEPVLHTVKLQSEGQSGVIVLKPEVKIESATWYLKMIGAATGGIGLCCMVSIFLPAIQKKEEIPNSTELNNVSVQAKDAKNYEIELVSVDSGTFKMGSRIGDSDARPVHDVTIAAFQIGKYPIRVADFDKFVQNSDYRTIAEIEGGAYVWNGAQWNKNPEACWRHPFFNQSPNHPVTCITWYDAISFCNWLSMAEGLSPCYKIDSTKQDQNNHYPEHDARWIVECDFHANGFRLPTEAEWEYAARGGTMSRAFRYAGSDDPKMIGWFMQNVEFNALSMMVATQPNTGTTQPVCLKESNELGIYDMSGNVREWCWDWYGEDYYGCSPVKKPKGPSSGSFRVNRGGSWQANDLSHLETTYRNYGGAGVAFTNFGFRIVKGNC